MTAARVASFLLCAAPMALAYHTPALRQIRTSPRDEEALARLQPAAQRASGPDQVDYRKRVVLKPWGYEYLILENEHVAVWFLHLGSRESTSMHCHPRKKTSLILLSGRAVCRTFDIRHYLNPHNGLILEPGVFHATRALSDGGVDLIEIETPPDKSDLVRLADRYGREGEGYEGLTRTQTDRLDRFGYFDFHGASGTADRHIDGLGRYELQIRAIADRQALTEEGAECPGSLYGLLSGRLRDADTGVTVETGDTVTAAWLTERRAAPVDGPLLLLRTGPPRWSETASFESPQPAQNRPW